tara:strand:+ start:2878 stop:5271 length:2394 start_codon:yes stop_codon:yes gene_type:complete
MPLQFCQVTNYQNSQIVPGATTQFYEFITTGSNIYLPQEIPLSNTLPRVGQLHVYPLGFLASTGIEDLSGVQDGIGYYSICVNDLSISGWDGNLQYGNWLNSDGTTHLNNPLYQTEYDPNNLTPTGEPLASPYPQFGLLTPLNLGTNNPTQANTGSWYKVFTKEDTILYGDQDSSGDISTNPFYWGEVNPVLNAESTLMTGSLGVEPGEDAYSRWNPYVDEVIMFNSLGTDEFGRGLEGNKVLVFVKLRDDVLLTESTLITVDIDGDAYWVSVPPDHDFIITQSPSISRIWGEILLEGESSFSPIIKTFNSWTVESVTISSSEIVSGKDPEKYRWKLIGPTPYNKTTTVATIEFNADDGYYFLSKPELSTSFGKNLKLSLSSTNKLNDKIVSYIFKLTYKSDSTRVSVDNGNVNPVGAVTGILKYEVKEIIEKTKLITSVYAGNSSVSSEGESRNIKVYGSPGAEFGLSITELQKSKLENVVVDSVNISEDRVSFDKIGEVSILNTLVANSVHDSQSGFDIPVLKANIKPNGYYSFKQNFPSMSVARTKTTISIAPSKTITLKSVENIKENDRVYFKGLSSKIVVRVTDVNQLLTRITVDTDVTIVAGSDIVFKRDRCYDVRLVPDIGDTIDSSAIISNKLYQYENPIITLTNSTANSNIKITKNNNIDTGLAAGGAGDTGNLNLQYVGKANTYGNRSTGLKSNPSNRVSILLDIQDGKTFTAVTNPKFSYVNKNVSSWTNTIPKDNGGTKVLIVNFSHGAINANTIEISYTFVIEKYGNKDAVIELDLDNIVTLSS